MAGEGYFTKNTKLYNVMFIFLSIFLNMEGEAQENVLFLYGGGVKFWFREGG